MTGFIARDPAGLQTTLGRNGSDFSASIFGALLDADEIVDLDRRRRRAERRSAARARRARHRLALVQRGDGARVLRREGHPSADDGAGGRAAASRSGSATRSRRTSPGTLICAQPDVRRMPVKGITSIDGVALVNVEGAGHDRRARHRAAPVRRAARGRHLGRADLAGQLRAFDLLRVPAVARPSAPAAVVRRAFDARAARRGRSRASTSSRGCSILAVVGDGMAGTPGVAAKVFGALGTAGVNVRAIAQGSSERNISVVIDERADDAARCAPCTRASTSRRTRSRSA